LGYSQASLRDETVGGFSNPSPLVRLGCGDAPPDKVGLGGLGQMLCLRIHDTTGLTPSMRVHQRRVHPGDLASGCRRPSRFSVYQQVAMGLVVHAPAGIWVGSMVRSLRSTCLMRRNGFKPLLRVFLQGFRVQRLGAWDNFQDRSRGLPQSTRHVHFHFLELLSQLSQRYGARVHAYL